MCAQICGPDCGPGLEGLTLPAGEENAAQFFGKALNRLNPGRPGLSFLLRTLRNRTGEHNLEHKFAVSNVELEGGDRGMKIVVQIVL